ncbi:M14 family metallopeptidase [Paremcibacter congregatus]|uniref:M14 family metallopeptidase n=1 Tax=Paremcibacter congregatus TaxID=2043170 RepID=UPI0030EE4AA8
MLIQQLKVFIITSVAVFAMAQGAQANAPYCQFDGVEIWTDFPTARVNGCMQKGDVIHLTIAPEVKPINPSPWYAFRVQSQTTKEVKLVLDYAYGKHRYWPKVSANGMRWDTLNASKMKLNKDKTQARLSLNVAKDKPLWVAAQEILSSQQHNLWMVAQAKKHDFLSLYKLGSSPQGRAIFKLESHRDQNDKDAVFLVGRQHPPEVTGALAMMPFMETLLADTDLARSFRAQFRLVMVPNLNPDGVDMGNWRTNAGGQDLNRDWGPFRQPETQLMHQELDRFRDNKAGKLALMLDFHSTHENLIYSQSKAEPTDPEGFARDWHGAIRARLPQIAFRNVPSHNAGLPTSKGYVYKNFGVPAITYEMGDNSDRGEIRRLAIVAAEEMMKKLLRSKP